MDLGIVLITAVLISRRCSAAVRDQSAELPVNHRFPGPLPGRMTLGMPRRLPIQAAQSRTGAPSARPTTTLRYSCVATTDTPRVVSLCEGTRGPPRFCHSTTRWPQLTHLGTKLRPRSGCPAQLSLPLQVAGCPARVVPSLGPSSSRSLLNRRKGANRGVCTRGSQHPKYLPYEK